MLKRMMHIAAVLALAALTAAGCRATARSNPADQAAAPQSKPVMAKICGNCHKPEAGNLRGNFENAAFKSESLQLRIDNNTEILKFDPDELKVVIGDKTLESEGLRDIKKGHEVRVQFTEKDGVKTAVLVSSKPPIKLSDDKLMATADVEKLVALGPEKGKYLLVDARPGPKFQEGAIPTAINIPFVAFDKMVNKLPQNKDALIIYYCGGVT